MFLSCLHGTGTCFLQKNVLSYQVIIYIETIEDIRSRAYTGTIKFLE